MSELMARERPILFSGEMVRAILSGAKTQTRRVVKPQPPAGCVYKINGRQSAACCYSPELDPRGDGTGPCWVPPTAKSKDHLLPCPYGAPGERLWVRETFMPMCPFDNGEDLGFLYRASDEDPKKPHVWKRAGPWKPSIHMPRRASRITLEITDVSVERLQEISDDDVKAEGVEPDRYTDHPLGCYWTAFRSLWESINGKGSWSEDPWVWVVKFRRIEQ